MVHLYKRITRKILLDYPNTGSWWQRVSDDDITTDIPAMHPTLMVLNVTLWFFVKKK